MNKFPSPSNDLSLKVIFGWGLGTLPVALFFNTFNALALRYLTDVVGLTAALAGSLVALSKLYDAFSDPAMGWISDRTHSRFGKRRVYILFGSLACGASLALLFSLAQFASSAVIVFAALIVYATAYTIYNVPYLAMPAEMTDSKKTRSAMMSWRVFFIGGGALIAGTLGPKIILWAGGGAEGHSAMGIVMGLFIFLSGIVTFFLTGNVPDLERKIPHHTYSFREKFLTVLSNRPFVLLLAIKLFQLSAVAISASTLAFFTVWILQRDYGALGTILLFTTVGQIIGTPVWLWIYRRQGAKRTFILSAFVFATASLTWLAADSSEAMTVTLARVFIKGLGTGGILLVGQSLLPDVIEYDRLRTGLRREGMLSGLYTTIEKIAFALGTAFVGIWLGTMGYIQQRNPLNDTQTGDAMIAIQFCQSIFPAALVGIAAFLILFYSLNEKKLDEARKSLATA